MEFWTQLAEESPDLDKLNELGQKINLVILMVDDQWNKFSRLNLSNPKSMLLYGKYLEDVLSDKENAEIIL